MVVLRAWIVGSLLALGGAASPVTGQHQYDLQKANSRGCTLDSAANTTSFILRDYLVETVLGADNTTQVRGTLSIENPSTGDTYHLVRIPVSVNGGTWSVCRAGDAPLPSQLARCQYLIERPSHRIGFRFQWYCDDKDSSQV
ncbi:hypothetical protein B0H67DRAFT_551746 [Lasiosphaeris hirsuta]|uniref:AA1-like domain-containing protein n=1 Tax=Lasiosphaeris hirsuta TaxID=260670 RepID=A0AA40DZI2_9PEZI|nr:hypothetical protein B0H67DRAFT_551746 [Lasiosphaeris hirsuta]